MPQIFMYSVTQPTDSTELTLINDRAELTLSTLSADVALRMLRKPNTLMTEAMEIMDRNEEMDIRLYAEPRERQLGTMRRTSILGASTGSVMVISVGAAAVAIDS